jgi:hypothetical protein
MQAWNLLGERMDGGGHSGAERLRAALATLGVVTLLAGCGGSPSGSKTGSGQGSDFMRSGDGLGGGAASEGGNGSDDGDGSGGGSSS